MSLYNYFTGIISSYNIIIFFLK